MSTACALKTPLNFLTEFFKGYSNFVLSKKHDSHYKVFRNSISRAA